MKARFAIRAMCTQCHYVGWLSTTVASDYRRSDCDRCHWFEWSPA